MIIRLVTGLCLFMAFPITILACECDDVQFEKVSKQLQENRHVFDKDALENPGVSKRLLTRKDVLSRIIPPHAVKKEVDPGSRVHLDDDLVLWFTKEFI